jgi:hypothetical protein
MDDIDVKSFHTILYTCECGYNTIDKSNSNKHSKTEKCKKHKIVKKKVEVIPYGPEIQQVVQDFENLKQDYEELVSNSSSGSIHLEIEERSIRLKNEMEKLEREKKYIPGIVYYVTDGEFPRTALIGVDTNTDIKNLHNVFTSTYENPSAVYLFTRDIRAIVEFIINKLDDDGLKTRGPSNRVIHCGDSVTKFIRYVTMYNTQFM